MNTDQIVDKRTFAMPGPMGSVTPEVQALHDETKKWRDEAEAFAGSTSALQDKAVSGLVADSASATSRAILADPTLARRSRQPIVIAAADSTARDRTIADYVCDGKNDEVELRQALQQSIDERVPLLVSVGGYTLDAWDADGYMLALPSDRQASVDIRGFGYPYRRPTGGTYELAGSVLHVSDAAYGTMPDNAVVLGLRARGTYPGVNLHVSNIGIDYPDNTRPATGIDATGCSSFTTSLCSVSVRRPNTLSTPESVAGFTGIRGIQVSSYGSDNLVDRCTVFLHRTGFDIEGEHMICHQCTARYCNYSYGIGITANGARGWHGCELVQCAQEMCLNYMTVKPPSAAPAPPVTIIDMTGEITATGTWAFQSVGHIQDSGTSWPVPIDASYSWASGDSNQVTLSYDLFDNATAYTGVRQRLSTYPATILYETNNTLLDQAWTLFPGQTKKRLPLPPLGQQVNIMLNNASELINNANGNFFKPAIAARLSGKTTAGAVKTYDVLCSTGDGQPIFKADADDIAAGRDLTYPYAPRNPHSAPAI